MAACLFSRFSRGRLFAALQTVARQVFCSGASPGKNTAVGCHSLLQGVFPTQGSNICLLNWQEDSLLLSHVESQ